MGLIQLIIDFIKKLLGIGGTQPALSAGSTASTASAASSSAAAAPPPPSASAAAEADDDDDDDDPGKRAQQRWNEMQAFVAKCESEGIDLAGIDVSDPISFWKKTFIVEEGMQEGMDELAACQKAGFRDVDHMRQVREYMSAKWSELGTDSDGEPDVVVKDEFQNAAMQARMAQMQAKQAAQLQADPKQLEPIEGTTLEQWAAASAALAALGAGKSEQEIAALLAKHGFDRAKYDTASAGWQKRMQNDPTGAIATKYSQAFAAAQNEAAGTDGSSEPCTFDKFVEIMAAQEAWSEQGRDVNAELQNIFSINAGEYSRYASYWSPKMGTDIALMRKYSELRDKYKEKYAGAGMDDDLSL